MSADPTPRRGADKQDRRVERTRQLLSDALRELTLEKHYESITIQNIIDRANVGRATFYAHFRHKDDLLLANFQVFLAGIAEKMNAAASPGPHQDDEQLLPSLALFRQVDAEFDRHCAAARGQAGLLVKARLHAFLSQQVAQHLETLRAGRPSRIPIPIAANYLVSALLSSLWWWVDARRPHPADEMDRLFQELARPTLDAVLAP